MRVALIGPPQSGKSLLFAAVAEAGGSNVDLSRPDQSHLAVVKVPDERLDWSIAKFDAKKVTHAELEFLDLPGFDLSDEAARAHSQTHWPDMRQSDMIVLVVRAFEADDVAAYRGRIDPKADVEEFLAEMLFADFDQVSARIGKLQTALKKPMADHQAQMRELDLMERLAKALESEKPISEAIESESEARLIRSFAFLSQKPVLVALNCSEDALNDETERISGLECIRLSAKIEEEIAQLPPSDRTEFLSDIGLQSAARDRIVQACYRGLNLVTFLTFQPRGECRAWTVPAGSDAVTAAGAIHSDIARGFIRAETVAFDDLRQAGDIKSAKAAGKFRLEGKSYIVQDGDVVNFRFNV